MNFGHGHGNKAPSQVMETITTTAVSTPGAVGGQFTDVEMTPTEGAATASTSMPPLKDAEPLEGAVAPNSDVYNPAGNKYTQSHSPKTKDEDSKIEPNPSSQGTINSSQSQSGTQVKTVDDKPPTPDICSRTPDMVVAQLDKEQQKEQGQQGQPELVESTDTKDTKSAEEWVNPLEVLLASVTTALGSTTVTEEEDHLLSVGNVTTTQIAVRPPPEKSRDISDDYEAEQKDDVKLTSADVGDNMEEI